MNRIELAGKRYGRLVVTRKLPNSKWCYYWEVVCDCGTIKKVDGKALRSGSTQSCGCLQAYVNSVRFRIRPYESLYHFVKRAAKDNNRSLDLTYEDFLKFTDIKNCHYCDDPVEWQMHLVTSSRYLLDRKDNDGGYSKENCVVCCTKCNFAKGNRYSYEEWVVMAGALKDHKKGLDILSNS